MQKPFYNNFKLGILGGGQLGRMLLQPAVDFNVHTRVLDPDHNAPCSSFANEFAVGKLTNYDAVYHFGKFCDLITIEIENVNVEALKQLRNEGIPVYPQPEIIELIQDKGLQKEFYKKNNIPTADFQLIKNKADLTEKANQYPFIQKLRKAGYDGKGVVKINSEADLEKAFEEPSILEQYIPFEKEIAVIVARNKGGEIKTFPVVEMDFHKEANLVEFLFAPANILDEVAEEARKIAVTIAEKLEFIGLLAVEMFVTKDNQILVNEIAPRPHNSGHHTIEANITSQYEQHLRAILNLPLGSTAQKIPAVMINLLGEPEHKGPAVYNGIEEVMKLDGVKVHLYGKKNTKPFRKMGHVTIIDESLPEAIKKANFVKQTLKVIS